MVHNNPTGNPEVRYELFDIYACTDKDYIICFWFYNRRVGYNCYFRIDFNIPTFLTRNMLIWYQLKVYQQALGFGWALFCG